MRGALKRDKRSSMSDDPEQKGVDSHGRERVDARGREGVAAVDRALSLLDAFRDRDAHLTLVELSDRTGLYKSTILRLAQTLERHGWLARRGDGAYHVGPAPLRLARLYQNAVKPEDVILPALRKLVEETAESAGFHIRFGDKRLCLYRVDSPQVLRDHFRPGDALPLERGAGGHVILAFTDPKDKAHMAVRERLLAVSSGTLTRDMSGVAAPVFDANDAFLGAISLSGPMTRFGAKVLPRFEVLVRGAARELTAALGGNAARFDGASNKAGRAAPYKAGRAASTRAGRGARTQK